MVLDTIAAEVFALVCHQDPARGFAPGGMAVALCARCTGVYIGYLLAVPLIFQARHLGRNLSLWLHGVLVVQVAVFGFNLIPHGAGIRLLSGQLFAAGVLYFLSRPLLPFHPCPAKTSLRLLLRYLLTLLATLLVLQLLVRSPWPGASVLNTLALLGLALLLGSTTIFLLNSAGALAVRLHSLSSNPPAQPAGNTAGAQ